MGCRGTGLMTCIMASPAGAIPTEEAPAFFAHACTQASYLAGCLSRMSDAVGAAFPGGARALPSPADVQKCIG